jgi:hypothetical protein
MAYDLQHNRAKQKAYLSGFIAVLLLSILGLVLQGGAFALVGLACCGCSILVCFYVYFIRINVKCLQNSSFGAEG